MTNFNDFINYCLDFYGVDGIYPENKRTKEQIAYATTLYLDAIAHYDSDTYTWGDGDSLDPVSYTHLTLPTNREV